MTKETSGLLLVSIVLAACLAIGEKIVMAETRTLAIEDFTGVTNILRKLVKNLSTGSMDCMDYAVMSPNDKKMELQLKGDDDFALFLAPNCSRDSSGRWMNCSSGDCPEGSLTGANNSVATLIEILKNGVRPSVLLGYNYPVEIVPMCKGCACPPISCAIPKSKWPEELRICNEWGVPIACMPGTSLPSCQDYTAPSSGSPSSGSDSCSSENMIIEVRFSV